MTDTELWQRVLASDDQAWRELIKKYEPLVFAVATRSGLSYADAADCFQQTWAILFDNRKKIKDPSRLSAWLVTTAKRQVIRMVRKQATTEKEDQLLLEPDPRPLPDDELEALQLRNHIQYAIEQIDSRCQVLVKLLFFAPESISYDQVAKKLNLSTNALGPARRRCLNRLRKILEKEGILNALI